MESNATAPRPESPVAGAGNVYTGEAYTDEVLMKAGAENIEEVNVANVHLVGCPFSLCFFNKLF
jgi:hypothetical protein